MWQSHLFPSRAALANSPCVGSCICQLRSSVAAGQGPGLAPICSTGVLCAGTTGLPKCGPQLLSRSEHSQVPVEAQGKPPSRRWEDPDTQVAKPELCPLAAGLRSLSPILGWGAWPGRQVGPSCKAAMRLLCISPRLALTLAACHLAQGSHHAAALSIFPSSPASPTRLRRVDEHLEGAHTALWWG